MLKHIFIKNGKEFIRVNRTNWEQYLDIVSPFRTVNYGEYNCSLRQKTSWCDNCNTGIGSYKNACVNIISSLNLQKYEKILTKNNKDSNSKVFEIEIDRNDNKGTI